MTGGDDISKYNHGLLENCFKVTGSFFFLVIFTWSGVHVCFSPNMRVLFSLIIELFLLNRLNQVIYFTITVVRGRNNFPCIFIHCAFLLSLPIQYSLQHSEMKLWNHLLKCVKKITLYNFFFRKKKKLNVCHVRICRCWFCVKLPVVHFIVRSLLKILASLRKWLFVWMWVSMSDLRKLD